MTAYISMRKLIFCALLWSSIITSSALATAINSYAVKPKWWDSVPQPELVEHKPNVEAVYLDSFKKTKAKYPKFNEDQLRIRIITDILDPDTGGKPHKHFAIKIASIASDIYLKDKDYANSTFWTKRVHHLTLPQHKQNLYWSLTKRYNNNPELQPYMRSFYKEYFFDSQTSQEDKLKIIIILLEMIDNTSDDTEILTFIKENKDILTTLVPKRILIYKIKGEVRQGNRKQAKLLLKELEKDLSDDEKQKLKFRDIKKIVDGIRQSTIQCPIDWEFDSIVRNAKNLAGESKNKLHQLIRSTLSNKYGQVIPSADDGLLIGAYFGYQKAFAIYTKEYNASLVPYLKLLKNTLHYTNKQIAQEKELLWLGKKSRKPTIPPQRQLTTTTLQLPASGNMTYQALLAINKGTLEIVNETSSLDKIKTKVQPAGIAVNKNLAFLQNSREIACLQDNKLKWRKIFDNSTFKIEPSIWNTYISGSTKPLTDTKYVYARLMQKSEFSLYAFHQLTGKLAWQLPDKEYGICSNPIFWNKHILVIARKKALLSKFSLLMINPSNGEIIRKLDLMQSDNYILYSAWNQGQKHVSVDYYMPTPTIIDDTAYILTNVGIVSSVDLIKMATNWQREYIRIPANTSVKGKKALSQRNQYAPVVNKNYVLFPTLDGATIQIIDRISGKIITEKVDSLWTEIYQIGNHALFFESSGKVDIRNLQNLKTIATLPENEYKYVASLKDGVVLKCANKLQVWNDKGSMVKEISIPKTFIPSLLAGGKIFGYKKNDTQAIVGFIGQGAKASSPFVGVRSEKKISLVQKGITVSKGNDTYIIADNYLIKLAKDLSYQWAVPHHNSREKKDNHIFINNKYIYMINQATIEILDRDTGRQVGHFPKYGEPLKPLTAFVLSKNKLFFSKNITPRISEIISIESVKARTIGTISSTSNPLCIMKNGTLIPTTSHYDLHFSTLDPIEKTYKITKKYTSKELDKTRRTNMSWDFRPVNDSVFVGVRGSFIQFIRDDMSFEQVVIPDYNLRAIERYKYKEYVSYGNIIAVPVPDKGVWHLIDTTKKSGLSTKIDIQNKPIFIKNSVYGVRHAKERTLSAKTFAIKTGKKTFEKEIPLQKIDGEWHYINQQRFSFIFNSCPSYLFLMAQGRYPSPELAWIIHNPATGKVEIKGLPDTDYIYGDYTKDNNIILCRENDILRFKYQDLDKLSKKSPALFAVKKKDLEVVFDGYQDEWPSDTFHKLGRNYFAISLSKEIVRLACIITDKNMIKKIGTSGLDNRFELTILPAAHATFKSDFNNREITIPLGDAMRHNKLSYSVSPSGARLFMEMEIPLKALKMNQRHIPNVATRERRGDIAFDISFRNSSGERKFVFAQKNYPTYFPRVLFSDL